MSVKVVLRAPEGEKEEFLGSSSILSISMGKKILLQAECLDQTINLINSTFASCDIVISDALQRFNFMAEIQNFNEKSAMVKALLMGDRWLEKNLSILSKLRIKHRITRWMDWLNASNYSQKYEFYAMFDSFEP